ncbi:hypothetical protein [Kribbella sp. NPDC000426]|uniref:hypothetical protein n=1 Tax=Kribbella sp. NPDC000426 TaxID=3154255 RepID=UPI003318F288
MPESAERVPEDSPTYREFTRLYELARQLRPTSVDRWNHELYETSGTGGFDQDSGAIGIHKPLLREGLATQSTANPRLQARALQAVLTRVTQAGMELDAPGETNAVRTTQSRGLHDGVASVRAATDLHAFSRRAGYPSLTVDDQQSGAYAAANGLIQQASGVGVDRRELIDRLSQGPAVMHFDQLAEAVVRNRLAEIAPAEGVDRAAVRRELVETMLHPQWESLAGRSPEAGQHVAEEIGRGLNAKVEEIRRRGPHPARGAESGDVPQQQVGRDAPVDGTQPRPEKPSQATEVPAARFLSGVAPAAGAAGRGSALGDGSRAAAARAAGLGRGASVPRGASAPRDTPRQRSG